MAVKFIDVSYKNLFKKGNFEIEKGRVISILGKGGSGKTTIFDLIFGQNLDFEGKIMVGNKVLDKNTKQKQIKEVRKDIFYLKQNYYDQLFNINILEDVKYFKSSFDNDEFNELLTSFGLDNSVLTKHYTELSEGEIKKTLLAIMIISNKNILLLDDVTAGLDSKGKKVLIKLLKKAKRDGKTIIISSLDTDFLLGVVDEIIYIYDGKITVERDKYSFFDKKNDLNKCNLETPKILQFKESVSKRKKIKLLYRDNISDLIKDIYRNAK